MNRSISLSILMSSVVLAGCGNRFFSPRASNPLIEDRVRAGDSPEQKMSVLSTRADRRTILIWGPKKTCAEPAPDVGEAVSAQIIAELTARSASAGFGSSSATAILPLVNRSQGLQFYRDSFFMGCLLWANGVMNEEQYRTFLSAAFKEAVSLTKTQIDKNNLPALGSGLSSPTPPAANPETPQPQPRKTTTTTTTTTSGG